jgi:hypothetical protein
MMADATVVSTDNYRGNQSTEAVPGGRQRLRLRACRSPKPALPSREEDTDAAFAATACCNAIPDAIAC